MTTFTRDDYQAVYAFARDQYLWHESTGRPHALKAALVMSRIEDVIGQQSDFPSEARDRLDETPDRVLAKMWRKMKEPL